MYRHLHGVLAILLVLAGALPVAAQGQVSPRIANYEIEVSLEAAERRLDGRQILTWTNRQQRPATELRFHLYWNAWRNDRSSWMLEDRLRDRNDLNGEVREGDWGYIQVDSAVLLGREGGADVEEVPESSATSTAPIEAATTEPTEPVATEPVDLTSEMWFDAPDDGNPEDRTVLVLPLPEPVGPGEMVRLEMQWHAKIPRTFARTGFRGNFFFLAHWFPKLGVFEVDGWNCHQYHAATEYYSDYGNYDVRITVPSGFVVGSTGRETEKREGPGPVVTHRFRQDDVHAFTWTASPQYQERIRVFESEGLPPVEMRLLIQPEHLGQVERHFAAASSALEHYGTWYGPYPYGHVTVIDPAWGTGAGGMEYPTLFTCGTRLFSPIETGQPEGVTIHEAGHQFWYGLVGNNEFEHAWLDEGLNTFSTLRSQRITFGDPKLMRRYLKPAGGVTRRSGIVPVVFHQIDNPRWVQRMNGFRPDATADDPYRPSFRYHPTTGGSVSYSKTALWLLTLERHLGWETLQQILSTFFREQTFGHPRPEDFFRVADEVSGRDLSWFFDQVYFDSVSFDYAIDDVSVGPAEPDGFIDGEGGLTYVARDDDAAEVFRSEVVVRRLGGGVFPVDLLLQFEDGSEVRRSWDGRGRHRIFVEERASKLARAVVDPDEILALDIYRTNNSRSVEPAPELPAAKWAGKWMIWLQDLMSTMSFYL